MRNIWRKYSVGVFLLAFLTLLFSGCSGGGGVAVVTQAPPASKSVSGYVSYLESGLPLPGAVVKAYSIDSSGNRSATPLGGSGNFAVSDVDGSYTLQIPADFAGTLLLEATVPTTVGKAAKSTPLVAGSTIRSLVPASTVALSQLPPVMLNYATEALMTFLEKNVLGPTPAPGYAPTGLSSDNIRKATIVMETFFGPDFSQVPPPKSEADLKNASLAQQNLLVSIQAMNLATTSSGTTIAQLVVSIATTGLGDLANTITDSLTEVVTVTLPGVLPAGYQVDPALVSSIQATAGAPVTPPDLSDTTAPAVPAGLAASAVDPTSVKVTWSASTDSGTGVAGYSLYRSVGTGNYALLATLGGAVTSYLDQGLAPSTQYHYKVAAFDGARNASAQSDAASVTTPQAGTPVPPASSFTVSGRITVGDAGLSGVLLAVSGAGSGSVVSASDGTYTFQALNGTYLVTPVLPGYQFTPASRTLQVNGQSMGAQNFSATPDGTATGTVTYPDGSANGTITYPDGSVTTVTTYPNGTVIGGVSYPPGTVITSVTYPNGTVIGGVTYPAGTVISTVTYPSGSVTGGGSYPGGSVTTIVTYPAGAVVGGVSYPAGTIVTVITTGSGTVIGGVSYPSGAVLTVTSYPNGSVTTSATYPSGVVLGGVSYPAGTVLTVTSYPNGTVTTSASFPGGGVVGGVSYPAGTVVTTTSYPNGAVVAGVTYPAGTVLVTVHYPDGGVTTTLSAPGGSVGNVVLTWPTPP